MNNNNLIPDTQILKIATKNSIFEVCVDTVVINKIKLVFQKNDLTKEVGKKVVEKIEFFLEPLEALYLAEEILIGSLTNKIKQNAEKNPEFPEPAYTLMKGKASDKEVISRIFFIQQAKSKDYPYLLKATLGPGIKNPTGIIIPQYNFNKAPHSVLIPISAKDFKILALALKEVAQVYFQNEIKEKITTYITYKSDKNRCA